MKQHSFGRSIALLTAVSLVSLAASVITRISAQTKPQSLSGIERLEGDWVRIDPNGSGDFGGLTSKFTPASLTPQGQAAAESVRRAQAAPVSYTHLRAHETPEHL